MFSRTALSTEWVTACNPKKGLMLGYIWKLSDYPWLDIWRHTVDGKIFARGLEFGTTSMGESFDKIIAKGSMLGHPLYSYFDAGQSVEKSYTAFLAQIPVDYYGVGDVVSSPGNITIKESGSKGRVIVIKF